MKKFLIALLGLAVMVTVASAGVGITWQTGWGAYTHDSPNITADPSTFGLLDNYNAIWQLIYAGADNAIDPPSLANAGSGYVTDDDAVWATRTLAQVPQPNPTYANTSTAAEDGTSWNNFMFRDGAAGNPVYSDLAWGTAGFVYQRIFEGTPGPGTYWYDSPLLALDTTYAVGKAPQPFNPEVNPGSGGFLAPPQNKFPPAIPEPATMGLLGLGALVMAIRRRRS